MSLARKAGNVSFGIFLSRILGLVREQVFAFFLGAGWVSDAFIVAFRIPNLLRDLFAEYALTSAFIPIFSGHMVKGSMKKAYRFANLTINLVLIVVGAITVLGIIGSPVVVQFIAPGFEAVPEKFALTVTLVRILMPFLLCISLSAIVLGILNSQEVYFIPAFAPAMFNLVSILAGGVIAVCKADLMTAVMIWTWGSMLGGIAQLAIQIPPLISNGFRYEAVTDIGFRDPSMRRLIRLISPSVIGLAATQVNVFVNTILASRLELGSVSWLNYAFRLIQLPIGIFGVAIATVNAVVSSKSAALKDMDRVRGSLASSLKLNTFLSLASTFGLIILGPLIINILFQHGRFTAADTLNTYYATAMFASGLIAYSTVKVIVPVFYALNDARTPMISALLSMCVNLAVSLATVHQLKFVGLALGTAAAGFVNYLYLQFVFSRKFGASKKSGLVSHFFRVLLACVVMSGSLYLLLQYTFLKNLPAWSLGLRIIWLFILMGTACTVFFLAARVLRLDETSRLMDLVRRLKTRLFG
jgi:putative peptidoglycan lipid II flippase